MWREGKFADAQVMRPDIWTAEDDAMLRSLAGSGVTSLQVSAEFRHHGRPRSRHAVNQRAGKLGISMQPNDWSAYRLCQLFGTNHDSVARTWLELGLLPAVKTPPGVGTRQGEWRIKEADIEAFIRRCPWAYDSNRMPLPNHPFTRLARFVQARDLWVQIEAAAQLLGLSRAAVRRWCYAGLIPYERRVVGVQGGVGGAIVIRASDLPALKLEIEARRTAARQLIRSKLADFNERRRAQRVGIAA